MGMLRVAGLEPATECVVRVPFPLASLSSGLITLGPSDTKKINEN